MSIQLYKLTSAISDIWNSANAVLDAADDGLPDLSAEQEASVLAELEARLKALEGSHAQKALDVACLIKSVDAEATAIASEESRLKARRKAVERKAEWLRTYLENNMEPGTKLKDGRAIIGWRQSSTVEVTCKTEDLPGDLLRIKTTIEPNKEAIKVALAAGREIAGCSLVTHHNLQIK